MRTLTLPTKIVRPIDGGAEMDLNVIMASKRMTLLAQGLGLALFDLG